MNLDPFNKYTDVQIWQALADSHLKEFVDSLPAGIDYECGEGGINLRWVTYLTLYVLNFAEGT